MKIFISCVSPQFKQCRDALRSDLTATGATVVVQEDFQQYSMGTLLEKLQQEVAGCDRIIALVGDAYGSEWDPASLPVGLTRRSYTQWEYHFALGERLNAGNVSRKQLFVYFADEEYLKEHVVQEDADKPALQRSFLNLIRASNEGRGKFRSLDGLCRLVLRDGFRLPDERSRPCHLPYPPLGELFVGRKVFLDDIRARYDEAKARSGALPNHAICGLGGVGKTRAAVEYAWQHREAYSGMFFVSGESENAFDRDLARLSGSLADSDLSAATDSERLKATMEWLRQYPGWLLIIDNVDDEKAKSAISRRLSEFTAGHVLITGRVSAWPNDVIRLELHVLEPKDATDFLLRATPGRKPHADDQRLAEDLANTVLGSLCLPLTQSAAYIDELGIGFAEYKDRWTENRKTVRDWGDKTLLRYHEDKDIADTTATTWLTSLQQLSPAGRGLLEMLAWLAPDPLPGGLMTSPVFETELRTLLGDPSADAESAVADLRRYSFLSRSASGEDSAPQLHRVVQLISRDRQTEPRSALSAALRAIDAAFAGDPQDVRTWPTLNPLAIHVGAVAAFADSAGITDPTARLMNNLAQLFDAKALLSQAEPLMRRALAIDEACFGKDHPDVAICLNNLAQLLYATNRPAEAEPLMRRALAIDESSFGKVHPDVARDLNNLAALLQAKSRLAEAEPLMRRHVVILLWSVRLDGALESSRGDFLSIGRRGKGCARKFQSGVKPPHSKVVV